MEFSEHKPIYLQTADMMRERIMCHTWEEEARIPSVRELGATLGVNPNTIVRTYQLLEAEDIIYNKRGIGYFVKEGARERIKAAQKREFLENELPQFKAKAELLGITKEELLELL